MLNLATVLETSARDHPTKTAVVFRDIRLTFAQINQLACQVASGLCAAGIRKGDKVALTCPNIPYFPILYYGILKAGAVVVPLNVLFKRREITYHLTDSDAKAYLCFEGTETLPMGEEGLAAFREVPTCEHMWVITKDPWGKSPFAGVPSLMELTSDQPMTFDTVQTRTDDTAVILYTSGTTGRPKGAELTHANLVLNAMIARDLSKGTPEDIQLVVLPLFHSFGQSSQMNAGFLGSSTLVLLPRFAAEEVWRSFQDENVTIFCGVPTMFWDLLNCPNSHKYDIEKIAKQLRICVSGGAAMPVEVMRRFEEKFNVTILEGYGLSETSPTATCHTLDILRKPGSIGKPLWGVEVRVVDDDMKDVPLGQPGEVVIRGHNVMKGYYKRPEANDEAFRGGWFHTGDVGKMDEDGYFYIVDRTKDMIIRGGFNVYPREVEEVLMTHPRVSLAAVVGVPDEEYGEEVKAYIVPVPGATLSPDEVIAWAKKEMAAYKYPRYVEIRHTLPMNATGKILKTELRAEARTTRQEAPTWQI
ncbi:MAG: long-chain fatty acid--CoA ligase [Candidatus Hydrogenedentes bacterium]|nr:long-chain fatty acid--CoA ligase [Candidatus Hydrogenedentota bacterium]